MSQPAFKYHAFVCGQNRPEGHPRGSCAQRGGHPLWERLMNKSWEAQRPDLNVTMTGCMGFCSSGPLMVVYPEGIWYSPQTADDVDEIFQSHFVEGKPVSRLMVPFEG